MAMYARNVVVIPAVILAFALLLISGTSATGPQATDSAGSPVPAVECTVEPRALSELEALIGISSPGNQPRERAAATAIPFGDTVDALTRGEIVLAAAQLIACGNTGDSRLLLSLYSDDLLRSLGPLPASTLASLATPEPLAPRATLLDVQNVVSLPDGRVSAVLSVSWQPDRSQPDLVVVIFVRMDGIWLLDQTYREIEVGDDIISIAEAIGTPDPIE